MPLANPNAGKLCRAKPYFPPTKCFDSLLFVGSNFLAYGCELPNTELTYLNFHSYVRSEVVKSAEELQTSPKRIFGIRSRRLNGIKAALLRPNTRIRGVKAAAVEGRVVKPLAVVALAVFFAARGSAQNRRLSGMQFSSPPPASAARSDFGRVFPVRGQSPPNGFPSGRVLFPGTGGPPGSPLSVTDTTFAARLGATVSGLNSGGYGRFDRPGVVVPYTYPVYVGGYSDDGNGYGYPQSDQPDVTIVNLPQQAPQAIINQNFIPENATPVMPDYREDSSGGIHFYEAPGREPGDTSADENTSFYLIAFKDHSIYSAFAYWVEGDTLHYVTPHRVHNQASLSLVDREFTERLNRNHSLPVKLPN